MALFILLAHIGFLLQTPVSSGVAAGSPFKIETWGFVERILNRTGQDRDDGAREFFFPRTDLAEQFHEASGLGLTSRAVFRILTNTSQLTADLVLTPDEADRVLRSLGKSHLRLLAISDVPFGSGTVREVRLSGNGSGAELAEDLHAAMAASATQLTSGHPVQDLPQSDASVVDRILGRTGVQFFGAYRLTFPRPRLISDQHSVMLGAEFETNIVLVKSGQGIKAIGSFILREAEVDSVLAIFARTGIGTISVSRIRSDMNSFVLVRGVATGETAAVLNGFREALDKTVLRRATDPS